MLFKFVNIFTKFCEWLLIKVMISPSLNNFDFCFSSFDAFLLVLDAFLLAFDSISLAFDTLPPDDII